METKGSLPHIQRPFACHFPEPDKSCPRPLPYVLKLLHCCRIIRVTVNNEVPLAGLNGVGSAGNYPLAVAGQNGRQLGSCKRRIWSSAQFSRQMEMEEVYSSELLTIKYYTTLFTCSCVVGIATR